jgi:hypothetical protein
MIRGEMLPERGLAVVDLEEEHLGSILTFTDIEHTTAWLKRAGGRRVLQDGVAEFASVRRLYG